MKNKMNVYNETTRVTPEIIEIIKELSKKRIAPKFDFNLKLGSYGVKKFKEYFE